MHAFLHHRHHRIPPSRFLRRINSLSSYSSSSSSSSAMASASSSLALPSISLKQQLAHFDASDSSSLKTSPNSVCFGGLKHGDWRIRGIRNFGKSRVVRMSVSAARSTTAVVDEALFLDYKPTSAFLFPGQGAQAVGMGVEAQKVPAAAELCKKANDILGWAEPAIYVTSLAAVEILRTRDGGQQIIESVDVTCGLSLGEYTALAFAGAFSIIGLDSEKVQLLCDAANEEVDVAEKVQIANFLCPNNYAVSGGMKGVEVVEAKAKSFKARMAVRLAVAGTFHTKFMDPAVSRLEAALAASELQEYQLYPTLMHNHMQILKRFKKILARQVTSPVQWETNVKTLMSKGLDKNYELGPGKVIAGIVKRVNKTAYIENISA